jgi:hypothetical protein
VKRLNTPPLVGIILLAMTLIGCALKQIPATVPVPTSQAVAVSQAAGVLKALASTPLPPGVDAQAVSQVQGWLAFGESLIPALEAVAGAVK